MHEEPTQKWYASPFAIGALKSDTDVIFLLQSYNTVDSRYLEFQGTFWNISRYLYFDISDLQNWGKLISINHI